ncbi:MAG: hypothetical protein HYS22_08370 [Deltaproteobacteria bacterium]|nr:hypothetical protein [Deltaproteobacteria bacterium]
MQRLLLGFLVVFFLAACADADLHHNLMEVDADEILVILQRNGIQAKKEKEISGQDVSWKIVVPANTIAEARKLLVQNNLPRRRELGLSGVYKEKGLVPTPDEQRARFLLALKGEIINSLRKIPGVVDSDVVLNIPTENEFSLMEGEKKRPTASVIVRTYPGEQAGILTEGKVQRFVANSIPNMDPNDVAVIVTQAPMGAGESAVAGSPVPSVPGAAPVRNEKEGVNYSWAHIAGLRMDEASAARFKIYALISLFALMILSLSLIINVVRVNRLKQKAQTATVTAVPLEAPRGGAQGFLPGGGGGAARSASTNQQTAKLG